MAACAGTGRPRHCWRRLALARPSTSSLGDHMPTRSRTSAAAARRRRTELAATHQGGDLDQQLQQVLDRFQPRSPLAEHWRELRPVVATVLAHSRIRGRDSFRKHLTHVGYFLAWTAAQGLPVDPRTVRRCYTDEYTRVGMPGSSAKSRADRRARLRWLADQLHPEDAPDHSVRISARPIKPPYTQTELAIIRRIALTQPTPTQRRQLCLCVALGAGAGIDSPDLRRLTGNHVRDLGEAGIRVDVPGPAGRSVPFLRDFEELARIGLDGVHEDQLLLGRDPERRNIAGRADENATLLGDVPRIEQSRLRSTWLATLLAAPVPLAVLLRAAGLRTARTLPDLLEHVPPATDPMSLLRDAGGAR